MAMRTETWGIVAIALGTACGSAGVGEDGFGPGGPFPAGTDGDTATDGETADGTAGEGDCQDGAACEGGACVSGECCPSVQACGTVCCTGADVCSFGACVAPAGPCETSDDCAPDYYCEQGLGQGEAEPPAPGCVGGDVIGGFCLPLPPVCEGGEPPGPGGLPTCVEACDVMPDASDLTTTLQHEIEGPGYTAPIVIQLDDDDCDGVVSERDVPEIVWNMHLAGDYGNPNNGRLKAASVVGGQLVEKWTYDTILPLTQVAGGDIDGNAANGNEVVACASDESIVALAFDGSTKWKSMPGTCGIGSNGGLLISVPNIADLDEDGVPEVITADAILDGATGAVESTYSVAATGSVAVSDVNGDGSLDILTGNQVFDGSGTLIATATGVGVLSWPAVGDLDGDGSPEIVAVNFNTRTLVVWRVVGGAAEIVRSGLPLDAPGLPNCAPGTGAAGNGNGGGPPTIGDFDGDGTPDVALAAGNAYVVYDGDALMNPALGGIDTVLWANPTNDCSSAQTGSTLFDFDGNGRVEVVYGDEDLLRIYDGLTGMTLSEHPHGTGTINEYPVVADVDADGQADIVAITRLGCGPTNADACGELRIYGSATGGWVRTRRVWNQYTYHVTNVNDDGTIPVDEQTNWTQPGLNNFRQNKQPGGEFSAGDAAITILPACFQGYSLQATVRNLGQAPIPSGATVTFFAGEPGGSGEVLGELQTVTTLYPAQSESLVLPLDAAPDTTSVYATVSSNVPECDLGNNASEPADPTCIPAG